MIDLLVVVLVLACTWLAAESVRAICHRQLSPVQLPTQGIDGAGSRTAAVGEHA